MSLHSVPTQVGSTEASPTGAHSRTYQPLTPAGAGTRRATGQEHSSLDNTQPPQLEAGTKIGDGPHPAPAKLVVKILRGDFVAMHQLLPECRLPLTPLCFHRGCTWARGFHPFWSNFLNVSSSECSSTWASSCRSFGSPFGRKRRSVSKNNFTWVQCFASYVTVLGPRFPDSFLELMAKQQSELSAIQKFLGRCAPTLCTPSHAWCYLSLPPLHSHFI